MKFFLIPFSFLLCLFTSAAAEAVSETTTTASDLTVTAPALKSVQQVGQDTSLATSLLFVPEVVVLNQGQPVGQADLSIRNSSFSAAGISISGLALSNAQTEHFHAELPLPGWWLGSPEVLTGVRQAKATEGFLTGTVSFIPLPLRMSSSRLTAGIDEEGGFWANANTEQAVTRKNGTTTGFGVFGGYTEIPEVDLLGNDVEATRGGARWQRISDEGQTDLMIGHQDKTFGATGFYGVSESLPAEEHTQDTIALASWQNFDPSEPMSASLFLRQFEDDYRLELPTSLFRNQHENRQAAAQVSRRFRLRDDLRLNSRLAADIEDIDSTALGDFNRSQLAVTLLPEVDLTEDLILTAGVRAEVLESFQDQWLPQVRLDWQSTPSLLVYAEYSASARRPSYTELNYESPGSLGNSGLDLQNQDAAETGIEWTVSPDTSLRALLFAARTEDTVDWIRPDVDASRWQAENIGDVDTQGTQLIATHRVDDSLRLLASWLWTDKDADNPPYASRYSLDYAEHLVRLQLDWTPTEWMRLELAQLIRSQVENELRTAGGDEQFLTNAALHLQHPDHDRVQLSFMVWNATDDDYRVFPGQNTVSERRVSAAVTVEL
jgi:iron complex outermembrane receptor protein